MQSSQKKIAQSRPPRIQICYEVETEGAIEVKELPFVVGVMGDFAADGGKVDSNNNPVHYPNTNFTEIDAGNFNEVMKKMNPVLKNLVFTPAERDNPQQEPYPGATQLFADQISFQSIDDFHPDNIISNTEAPRDNPSAEPRNSIYYEVSGGASGQDEKVSLHELIELRSDLQSLIDLIQRSPAIEGLLFQPPAPAQGDAAAQSNKNPPVITGSADKGYSLEPDFVTAVEAKYKELNPDTAKPPAQDDSSAGNKK